MSSDATSRHTVFPNNLAGGITDVPCDAVSCASAHDSQNLTPHAHGGYYFTRAMTDLPLFQLTESELVCIFVAQKALEAYKGTAFEQPLRTAFQKLQAATNSSASKVSISWEDLDSAIS